ncbi:hypothetical protein MMC22_010941 [Lobaria immixta]|nr:hypothetical protein [Lobaria immixta]
MHCNLLSLPAELQLKIIEELVRDEDIKTHVNDGEWGGENYVEKQDEPIKIYPDLINWSATCSFFRNLLAPHIFKTVKLLNDEKSGSSLNSVARSPNSVHVKELHFIGSALGSAHDKEAAFFDTEGILPRSVEAILCDLQRFPRLERLSIKFDYTFKSPDWIDNFAEVETPEQVLEAEASVAWRALMSRTYTALAQNKSPHFNHLEIRQLISKMVSTFSHAAFHGFLSHFEQFTLSIFGQDFDETWLSDTSEEYPALVGKLDDILFNHLSNVTTISIKAPAEGPFGFEGGDYTPLSLKADQMPLLTTLHLDYIFACPELINFVVGHRDTLERVILRNYFAASERFVDSGIPWSEFFTSLFSACPAQLCCFELVGSETPLPSDEQFGVEGNEMVRAILRQDPGRILFPYGFLDESYGTLLYDEQENLAQF